MIFDLSLLTQNQTNSSCKPIFVTLPYGTFKPVLHTGKISLTPSLILHNVLHVPDFKFNLLLVSKLVTNSNMCVIFFPDTCTF